MIGNRRQIANRLSQIKIKKKKANDVLSRAALISNEVKWP
jgi:hypothetical protein